MKKLIIIQFLVLLQGCSTNIKNNESSQLDFLNKYKRSCDAAILNGGYDKSCDNYIKISSYEPLVYDPKIAKVREKYSEYKWQLNERKKHEVINNSKSRELDLLLKYKRSCDAAMSKGVYDKSCDNYIKTSSYEPLVYDKKIAKVREKYSEYKWQFGEKARQKKRNETFSPAKLKKMNNTELCLHFFFGIESKILTGSTPYDRNIVKELKKRKFKESQIKKARKSSVSIGSPVCMLYAAWGKPTKENRTVRRNGVHIQHIYRRNKDTYFYSDNGVITSLQD